MKKELIFSLIGYICLLIVGWVMGLWIYTADSSKPYKEVQQQYQSYFPTALTNGRLLCASCIGLSAIGIFSLKAAEKYISSKTWRGINTGVIVLLGLLLFMNLWSLM
jgi:hypothetical protein